MVIWGKLKSATALGFKSAQAWDCPSSKCPFKDIWLALTPSPNHPIPFSFVVLEISTQIPMCSTNSRELPHFTPFPLWVDSWLWSWLWDKVSYRLSSNPAYKGSHTSSFSLRTVSVTCSLLQPLLVIQRNVDLYFEHKGLTLLHMLAWVLLSWLWDEYKRGTVEVKILLLLIYSYYTPGPGSSLLIPSLDVLASFIFFLDNPLSNRLCYLACSTINIMYEITVLPET